MAILRHSVLSKKDVARVVRQLSTIYNVKPPRIKYVPLHGWAGEYESGEIRLATDHKTGRSPLTVIHEFAHYLVHIRDPENLLESHGPEFVAMLGHCYESAGAVPRDGFDVLCKDWKVKALPIKKKATPAQLKATVARTVKARSAK